MKKLNKQKSFTKNDSYYLYQEMPVWKTTLKVGSTGFIMALVIGLFTFADQLMLVNFMPGTEKFSFDSLFYFNKNVFSNILNDIKNSSLYSYLIHSIQSNKNNLNLKDFIYAIGNVNGLGVYNSDSIVRSAVSLTVALSDVVYVLPGIFGIGVSIMYGNAIGKNDTMQAINVWRNSFYGAISVTFIGVIIVFILIPLIIPAQAVVNHINLIDYNKNWNQFLELLNNNHYLSSSYFDSLSKGNQTIVYAINNDKYDYYLQLNNNIYLNINSTSINNINSNNLNNYIVYNLNTAGHFQLNFHNNILPTWKYYFSVVRNYSINWAQDFLYIVNSGLVLASLTSLIATILRSDGVIKETTIFVIVAIGCNILLDYVLIVYAQIGMDGAGVATLFGWIFELILLILYLKHHKKIHTLITFKQLLFQQWKLDFKLIWKLMLNGGAVFVGSISFMISDIILSNQVTETATALLSNTGSEYYLSILGSTLPIVNLFVSAILGFLQYAAPIFTINFGAKKYKRFQLAYWWVSIYALVVSLILYGIICYIPECTDGILSWFKINKDTADNALYSSSKLLKIWFIQVIAFAIAIGNYLSYLSADRIGLTAIFDSSRGIFIIIAIYIFSSLAINNQDVFNNSLSSNQINDPAYNNAMWFFMWSNPVGTLFGSIFMFICATWFIYKNLPNEKRKMIDIWPIKIFKHKNLSK